MKPARVRVNKYASNSGTIFHIATTKRRCGEPEQNHWVQILNCFQIFTKYFIFVQPRSVKVSSEPTEDIFSVCG